MSINRLLFCFLAVVSVIGNSYASDVRKSIGDIVNKRNQLLRKSIEELNRSKEEYKINENKIRLNKEELIVKIKELKEKKKKLQDEAKFLKQEIEKFSKEKEIFTSILEKNSANIDELIVLVRQYAKELESAIKVSPYSAIQRNREKTLVEIQNKSIFPGMKDLITMSNLAFEEIINSSEVALKDGVFIDREGLGKRGKILFIGPFTQVYITRDDFGFLLYSDKTERFFALSKTAPYFIKHKLQRYLEGKSESVPVDISKGGAIRQFVYEVNLWDKIKSGGPIVWPILFIGVVALIIIITKIIYLRRIYIDPVRFLTSLNSLIEKKMWEDAISLCNCYKKKLVPRIILKCILNKDLTRQDLENVMQEEILRRIPNLERFISTLGMLGKISPLLGLLGTVTGMINTFHMITYFGTSDPRLMSSGISEALVTTMLGLTVAIPIMISHTILTKVVDNFIAHMEQCTISVVNTLFFDK